MRVVIIGAGAAGLASARHTLANGHQCDVLELAPQLGGTWLYTDEVGTDKYGFPVYSAMYKGLRTNLPKEVMGFPDFPIPEQNKSYLTQAEILDFLNSYADNFGLRPHIKFNHHVMDIRPTREPNKWLVTSINKPTREKVKEVYDAVMICNGHYNEPITPKIPGQETFRGSQSHSHHYRSPENYRDQRVLVIGAGPSGLDLAMHISTVASQVVLSHHIKELFSYPPNVIQKPDVRRIRGDEEIEFVDGSCCCFDAILYCTGYKYSFSFLHESCGVTVDENYIQPLYKHMIHIDRPTMCFIGIPFNVCAFQMFDLQARYFVKSLDGTLLPDTELMRSMTKKDMEARWDRGYNKKQAHLMGPYQKEYYDDLAKDADLKTIPNVIIKLRDESVKRLCNNLLHFREDRYKIVDEENFIQVH